MTSKILVIRFSSLGDIILATATVLNLKIAYPESSIYFLTKKRFAAIAARIPGVEKVIEINESPKISELIRLIRKLEKEEIEIIVDLQGNFRSFLIRTLLFAKQKVVYARDRASRSRIVRFKDFPQRPLHTIDKYNECITELEQIPFARRPILGAQSEKADSTKPPIIVVAPGASSMNKQWPVERFAEVAVQLQIKNNAKIIWASSSAEKTNLNLSDKFEVLVDCPIDKLADIIHNADLCLANDSGIAHLSSAVGTPVNAIFGPTHPALGFAPRGLFDKVIEVDEYCRPCSLHGNKPCFREERFCFTRIGADIVVAEVQKTLLMKKSKSPALFVDRDGTVIIDKPFDSDPDNIEFESGSIDALKKAMNLGYKLVIVSNQSGIARGYFKLADAENFNHVLNQKLKQNGVDIDAIYFCPHYPRGIVPKYANICNCRKPAPGMAEKAARELNIDLRRAFVVGDKMDDFNLGRIIGAGSFLVKTGQGKDNLDILRKSCENADDFICDNLNEAVDKIEKLKNALKKAKLHNVTSRRL